MPTSKRSAQPRRPSALASQSEPTPVTTEAPADPARVAADLLLRRAVAAAGFPDERVGGDGTVALVIVPSLVWAEVACKAWRHWRRGGEPWIDGTQDRYWDKSSWAVWLQSAQTRHPDQTLASLAFGMCISRGQHCLGIAADLSWLPGDLVQAADHRLTLPAMTVDDVANLAAYLCGGRPTETLDEDQAAALTPRLLRLARRLGQAADEYVVKLRSLLAWEQSTLVATPVAIIESSPRHQPSLDRLHGMHEAVDWGLAVAGDLNDLREGRLAPGAVDVGCLLSGPPGCGKTLFARALAATCGVPLVTGSYSMWLATGTGHQGDLLRAMRKTFVKARSQTPCILFIDEVDSFPNRATIRHENADWHIQVVNALLAEIDGCEDRPGVVLVAACNHPDRLDPALVRSGRLDRHIRVGLPDRGALECILREHLGDDLKDACLKGAALAAAGMSGADCERLVRGAQRRARTASRPLELADVMVEVRGSDDRTPAELWRMAVHEAGHAVATCVLSPGTLQAVTLRAVGSQGGSTRLSQAESFYLAGDVQRHLVQLLAGRAAEEALLGQASSGAGGKGGSDLAQATRLAATASTALGLDAATGLVWSGTLDGATLTERMAGDAALVAGVRRVLDGAYTDALTLVSQHLVAVNALAVELLARCVMDGAQVVAVLASHPARPECVA